MARKYRTRPVILPNGTTDMRMIRYDKDKTCYFIIYQGGIYQVECYDERNNLWRVTKQLL